MKASEQIETEIEQTRGAMSDTLQAIERRLSPNRLVDEAMQTMRNINISNSPVFDAIRDNPLPLAVAGIGLGWLALAALGSGGREAGQGGGGRVAGDPPGGWAGYGAGAATGGGNGSGSEVTSAEDGEGGLHAGNGGAKLGRRIERFSDNLRGRAGDIAARGSDVFQDHPVAVGLLAMVAGLALGLALPRGRRVYELVESAADSGEQALRKTGKVIRHAAAAVGEGATQTVQRASEALRS